MIPFASCLTEVYLEEMCEVARKCYERGWTAGTGGNFSVRDQQVVWQSPSGVDKGSLKPRSFLPVQLQSGQVCEKSLGKVSLELPVHLGLYRLFPEARAVVHAHTPALIKLTNQNDKELKFVNQEMQKSIGGKSPFDICTLPVCENLVPAEFGKFSDPEYLRSRVSQEFPMVILKGHGAYVYGISPMHALRFLEGIEFLCETGNVIT